MLLGYEQIYHPNYSLIERMYIAIFGMPIVGLRIRARNIFSLIPKCRRYFRILDAGSGQGVFTFELGRRFPDAMVTGIDPLGEAITACNSIKEKVKAKNVEFCEASIEELSEHKVFDLIICVDIIEHIHDDLAALRGLHHLLTPEGILILHVPAMYRRYPIWRKKLNFDVETHVRPGFGLDEIQDKAKEAGFLIRKAGYTYGFWETLANNLSYMITRARMQNKILYSLFFPILNAISLFGARARPKTLGAGIYVIAGKG
ncbi:MAG: class I SAM-dependent methyltransferase [Thermodesulfobacteriota bacterium]|nr:class I SAM-dependent methyltransferase [Thermodesulfobacteriota bacterium]